MKKKVVIVDIPEHLKKAVGTAVHYYYEGWRVGYIEGFRTCGDVDIQPVGALGGQKPHRIFIPQTDIKLPETEEPEETK